MRFVTIKKYAELSGSTASAIRKLIERGNFVEGIHYKRRPGSNRIYIDVLVVERWLMGVSLKELRSMAQSYE